MKNLAPIISLFIFALSAQFSFAQPSSVIEGYVVDKKSNDTLAGARIALLSVADSSIITGVSTDESGFYSLQVTSGTYILKVSMFSYVDQFRKVNLKDEREVYNFQLVSDATLIEEVSIEARAIRVEQKGDTTQYNADAFKTNPDASVEDLVAKMPGITIENGVVKAQGEQIKKVYIDGEEFFGDDVAAALKNLPAEIVSKIQVYENASEQSRFTGVSDGNEAKALNIVTKPGKSQGQFGKIYAGYGYPDLYLGGLNVNIFKGTSKLSIIGMTNNVNQQNFSSEDILGVSGSTSERGGSRGQGQGENYMVNQQRGISQTHSIGLNYSDKWGSKTRFTGSYFFNASNNNNTQLTNREYVLSAQNGQLYDEEYSSKTRNFNHRLNMKIDLQLDSLNSLVITPKLSYQGNNRDRSTIASTQSNELALLNSINNLTFSENNGINAGLSVLWRHRFMKPKRTLSINLNGNYTNRTGSNGQESYSYFYNAMMGDSLRAINQFADNLNAGYTTSARLSYTEPLGKFWTNEVNYTPSFNWSNADKRTLNFDPITGVYSDLDTLLSNVFVNKTLVNEMGTGFGFKKEKVNLQFGANYQNTLLLNNQEFPVDRNVKLVFNQLLPNFRFRYDFTKTKSLNVNYRASTRTPSIDQLQNVIDNSNPLSLSSGNERLKQQYNHRLFARFNLTNVTKGSNFYVFMSGEMANNFITNSTIIATSDTILEGGVNLARGSQFRKPVNLEGNWATRAYVSYGFPITKLKLNMNFNLGGGYGSTPGLINNVVNKSNTTNANAGIVIASNISANIDFTVGYTFNYNNVQNTRQNRANNEYFVQNVSARFNWIIKERLVFNTNYVLNAYAGLGDAFNQTIMVWNAGLGYKLLKDKSLEIRLSVFDILNSNNSIVRNVTESYIEDVQSRVLNRYFMITATYNLRNFGSNSTK